MKLTEILEVLKLRSGQFIVGELETYGLNFEQFYIFFKQQLNFYENYFPEIKKYNITNQVNFYYTFGTLKDERIPEWVASVIPIGLYNVISTAVYFSASSPYQVYKGHQELMNPRPFLWEYRKPQLYISEPGRFDVSCCYRYEREEIREKGQLIDVEIKNFDPEWCFYDLVLGQFLQMIGRSRRAFTYQELPITTDADQLVTEGTTLYENARDTLFTMSLFYSTVRA
jgi:hypothetical protein